MDSMTQNNFYQDIIHSGRDISEIFEEKIVPLDKKAMQAIQNSFHDLVDQEFEIVKANPSERGYEERYKMNYSVFERYRVASLLLTILVLGGKYDAIMFERTLKFCNELNGAEYIEFQKSIF